MVGSSTKDGIATLMIKPAYPIQQHKGPKFGPGIDVIGGRLALKSCCQQPVMHIVADGMRMTCAEM